MNDLTGVKVAPQRSDARPGTRRRLGYHPELDGIRGVAILAVMAIHSEGWFPNHKADGGALGVDLFFVLSGFLITSLLLEERDHTGTFDRSSFYMRRALRLLPALFIALIFAGIVVHVIGTNLPNGMSYGRSALAALFFAGDFFQYKLGTLSHTWSLGVEEQYYLVWPAVLVALLRKNVPTRRIVQGLLIVILAVAGWRTYVYHAYPSTSIVWRIVHPWSRMDGVLIGSLLAILWSKHEDELRLLLGNWEFGAAGVLCGLAVALRSQTSNASTYDFVLLANVSFAVVIGHAVATIDSPIARFLRLRPLVQLGRISYGLYLLHWPLFILVQREVAGHLRSAVLAWTLSIAGATASYHLIERPILRYKARLRSARA